MNETMMIIIEPMSSHSKEMKGDGKGGEMDIMGYQTQNFHICPGAQEAFSTIIKEGHRGEEAEMVINIAMLVDEYLGLEIQAKETGASPEIISSMVDKGNSVMFHLGVLASATGDESMIQLFNFMPKHVIEALGMESNESMGPISMEGMGDGMSIEMGGEPC